MNPTTFYEKIKQDIEGYGQSLIGVGSGVCDCCDDDEVAEYPFIYTIGNSTKGLPELLVIGFADSRFGSLLNHICDVQRERGAFKDGQLIDIGGKVPLKAVLANEVAKTEYTIQVGRYLESEEYEVIQLLVPDPQGRFPGDPSCDEPYASVPVLRAVLH